MSEIAKATTLISNEAYREIADFQDAMLLAKETFGDKCVSASEVLGDGFVKGDKAKLLNIPFVILSYTLSKDKKTEQEFAVLRIVTKMNDKLFITDGGTGIFSQLLELAAKDIHGGIYVGGGLRSSTYEVENEDGQMQEATTYYLNTSE